MPWKEFKVEGQAASGQWGSLCAALLAAVGTQEQRQAGRQPPQDSGPTPVSLVDSCVLSSTQEQAIGLVVTFVSFLIPAGWVLSNLESYKRSSSK